MASAKLHKELAIERVHVYGFSLGGMPAQKAADPWGSVRESKPAPAKKTPAADKNPPAKKNPTTATRLVEKLITEDGIRFILGPYGSGITLLADMPGVSKDRLEVNLDGDKLSFTYEPNPARQPATVA